MADVTPVAAGGFGFDTETAELLVRCDWEDAHVTHYWRHAAWLEDGILLRGRRRTRLKRARHDGGARHRH